MEERKFGKIRKTLAILLAVCFLVSVTPVAVSAQTYEVHGAIRDKWTELGGTESFLGYPLTDETVTPDGTGRYNHFQGGSIYWTSQTGAHEVHGAIRDKWAKLGWEKSYLGYPISDEKSTSDGKGRYSEFQGGTLYWTP